MNKSPHIYPETDTEFEDINSNLPLISIGVPVRNSERTIRQSLNSLVNQTYPNLEIIVSDNASTDNTLWSLEKLERLVRLMKFEEKFQNLISKPN